MHHLRFKLDIRSVERGICRITALPAAFYARWL